MALARIQVRRGTTSQWSSSNPILAAGEPGFDTTLKQLRIGDGSTPWSGLPPATPDAATLAQLLNISEAIEGATTPTDAVMTAVLANEDSAFAIASKAAVDEAVGAVVAPGTAPRFVRANSGNPVLTTVSQNPAPGATAPTTAPSIYFPYIIDARKILGGAALDEFYMYYSTDHEATHANSGIWLATAPTELGPWTGRGRVFIDNVSGNQTETPCVFPDPTGANKLIMLYQQASVAGAVGNQTTLYAVSNDGVAWTRQGIAIDVPAWWPSDGHTGYRHAYLRGGTVFSHGLAGGGDFPRFSLAQSADGRTWQLQAPLAYGIDQTGDGRMVNWNHGDVVTWRGQLWWVGLSLDFVSGVTPANGRIIAAPIAPDLRSLVGKPVVQLYPTQGAEGTNYRSIFTFVARDGRLVMYYTIPGGFFVAEAR